MDSITVHTVQDLKADAEIPRKRKYTSKACSSCRQLKIRCRELETSSGIRTCEHCFKIQAQCTWPESDRRKWRRTRSISPCSTVSNVAEVSRGIVRPSRDLLPQPQQETLVQSIPVEPYSERPEDTILCSPPSQTSHTVVQYYRYLGPTAIAPGYKKISLKVTNDSIGYEDPFLHRATPSAQRDVSVLDPLTNLPRAELLPHLLDAFFEYYGSYFCFLNRGQLESLIQRDEISTFLLCSIAALSARFCDPGIFTPYLASMPDLEAQEHWHYSLPFLNHAKTLLVPLLSIPSRDLVAGLLFLALAEFGDNNEAGMWMFTGMSTKVAQELGLHRKHPSVMTSIGRSPVDDAIGSRSEANEELELSTSVSLMEFERSSQIILWWCVFVQDTSLANGTGRVPSIKRSEISIQLPTDNDLANVKAGPGGIRNTSEASVFPSMIRLMLEYSRSIEFLNTDHQSVTAFNEIDQTADTVETARQRLIATYDTVPETIGYGAKQYRSASDSGQAISYLLLHLNYHLQIAFLTQASHAPEHEFPRSNPQADDHVSGETIPGLVDPPPPILTKHADELYRKAIRTIVHLLTIARFVDDRPICSIFWLNQAFFHAACAYAGDMLRFQGHDIDQFHFEETTPAFPLPSRFSTSVVVDMDDIGEGSPGTNSTDAYLALLAKTNYQFLRQAIKDMAKYYAGAGWVDAVLDQRESGIRDVDLSIVSESISTYIRLHDLRRGSPLPRKASVSNQLHDSAALPSNDTIFPEDLLSGIFPEFDSQAFFNDYIFTGKSNIIVAKAIIKAWLQRKRALIGSDTGDQF